MKQRTNDILANFYAKNPALSAIRDDIEQSIELLIETAKKGKKILVCGNGGSASDSQHIAGELMKSFVLKRKLGEDMQNELISRFDVDGKYMAENLEQGVKCIPLIGFDALSTAFANDKTADLVFAQQVNSLGDSGDLLICISTSGNSSNVVYAAKLALVKGLTVISLTGSKGGKLKDLSKVTLKAPSDITYEIQEYHLPIYHLLCLAIESELYEY